MPFNSKQPIRIAVVDDSPIIRNTLKALLSLIPGLQLVGEAGNGLEAIKLVDAVRPDVVILDHMMPVLTGLDATRTIKSKYPATKVILLTMNEYVATQAMQAGASLCLIKGCPFKEILAAIVGQPEEVAAPA